MDSDKEIRSSEDFKNRLNELLCDIPGTKKSIAQQIGIDFRSLSNAYNFGIIPRVTTIIKLADYFNVPINYLLGRSDNDRFIKALKPSDFYTRYSSLRDEEGKSDNEIASCLHFDRTLCYKWKSKGHTPTLEVLDLLCDYFNVSADYLLGRTDIK